MNEPAAPPPANAAPATASGRRIDRRGLLALGTLLFVVSTVQTWWANRYDDRLGDQVAALAVPGDIRMFSSETCASCQLARQWLVEHRVPFRECVIERDAACQAEFQANGAPGTPLFRVRGQQMLGFTPEGLEQRLRAVPASKDL